MNDYRYHLAHIKDFLEKRWVPEDDYFDPYMPLDLGPRSKP